MIFLLEHEGLAGATPERGLRQPVTQLRNNVEMGFGCGGIPTRHTRVRRVDRASPKQRRFAAQKRE